MACALLAFGALSGCNSREGRATEAYGKYQAAAAANDMVGAQQALLQLVAVEDRVSEYWMALARIQAASGSTGDAYHSLTRAYELDRSNVGLLRALTEFALRGGDPARAQIYARELEVMSPGDPWVNLTFGYGALRENRFDEALAASGKVLETSPFDTHAKVLKARALLGKKQEGDAVNLLIEQVRAQPNDAMSLQLLANIYELRRDWAELAPIARRLTELRPADEAPALLAIGAAFKAGQFDQGRRDSINLVKSGGGVQRIYRVLDIWMKNWPSSQRVEDAFDLGRTARHPREKVPYADFLNRIGSSRLALRLVAETAKYPITTANADAHAVAANALGDTGRMREALKRIGDVLAFDPGNSAALRGRSEMLLRSGRAKDAVADAEKLVTVVPDSARDRLLLARVYTAAGDPQQAQRTLWDAFRAIPGDEQVYGALVQLTRSNPDRRLALRKEFDRQNVMKLSQGLL